MKDADFLGDPQIKLASLEIWVHSREFPNEQDYWDGNWLRVTARCSAPGALVLASGPIVHLSEIDRWHTDLRQMKETLSGNAILACVEPNLSVALAASSLGRVKMEVKITPDHLTQQHSFTFEIDQSYLDPLLRQCRAMLETYPIRGERPVVP